MPNESPKYPEYLTTRETCLRFRISRTTLTHWLIQGAPVLHLGRKNLYDPRTLGAWLRRTFASGDWADAPTGFVARRRTSKKR